MIYLEFVLTTALAISLASIINPNKIFELTVVGLLGLIYYTLLKIENRK